MAAATTTTRPPTGAGNTTFPTTNLINHHHTVDLEKNLPTTTSSSSKSNYQLDNTSVTSLSWSNLRVLVTDSATKTPRPILADATGLVRAGEMLAVMGPSGSGKTTLLNALARRGAAAAAGAVTNGNVLISESAAETTGLGGEGGAQSQQQRMRELAVYVEQEEALTGCLTARETVRFAARLALSRKVSSAEITRRVDDLISSLGLQGQADTIVGTPIKKGLSGGQKKRVSIASRLVTSPSIVFLDEPTSGLDSALAAEVVSYLKSLARRHKPSTATFRHFDKLCLMSGGRTCFFGPRSDASAFLAAAGHPLPAETNPAEFYLDLINTDLDRDVAEGGGEITRRTDAIVETWRSSPSRRELQDAVAHLHGQDGVGSSSNGSTSDKPTTTPTTARTTSSFSSHTITTLPTLLHRHILKSLRDPLPYFLRLAMYTMLALLMGTVFLSLGHHQSAIQPYVNALFFGGAFMSFMAVAYVPSFLEDLAVFRREEAEGLVGPGTFLAANFLAGLPWLFVFALVFSLVEYWATGFKTGDGGTAFAVWVLWLWLDLLAAESLVVLVSSACPVFVVALAVTAFANGLWMCVDGFLVPLGQLNVFWKYVFHYIDYQAYVFQGMMVNEFLGREYECDEITTGGAGGDAGWQCMYPSDLNAEGKIGGLSVLQAYNIDTGLRGTWIGISIGIIAGYRLLAYLVLILRR